MYFKAILHVRESEFQIFMGERVSEEAFWERSYAFDTSWSRLKSFESFVQDLKALT